jgi:A/G-specific adenine glycosylase
VIQRVFDIQGDSLRTSASKQIWLLAEKLIPQGQAHIFNQAIMDFGALICAARKPHCQKCFMNTHCRVQLASYSSAEERKNNEDKNHTPN